MRGFKNFKASDTSEPNVLLISTRSECVLIARAFLLWIPVKFEVEYLNWILKLSNLHDFQTSILEKFQNVPQDVFSLASVYFPVLKTKSNKIEILLTLCLFLLLLFEQYSNLITVNYE